MVGVQIYTIVVWTLGVNVAIVMHFKTKLYEFGCSLCLLSGAGQAVYGLWVYQNLFAVNNFLLWLEKKWTRVYVMKPLNRLDGAQ